MTDALSLIRATVEPGIGVSHEWIQDVIEAYVMQCLHFGLDQGETDVTYADNGVEPDAAKALDPAGYHACASALTVFLTRHGAKLRAICHDAVSVGEALRGSVATPFKSSELAYFARRANKEPVGADLHEAMRTTKWYITCHTRTQRLVFKEAKWR